MITPLYCFKLTFFTDEEQPLNEFEPDGDHLDSKYPNGICQSHYNAGSLKPLHFTQTHKFPLDKNHERIKL